MVSPHCLKSFPWSPTALRMETSSSSSPQSPALCSAILAAGWVSSTEPLPPPHCALVLAVASARIAFSPSPAPLFSSPSSSLSFFFFSFSSPPLPSDLLSSLPQVSLSWPLSIPQSTVICHVSFLISAPSRQLSDSLINICPFSTLGLPWWLSGKESACQCRRCGFDPSVAKIHWRRKWQHTPVFLPGQRSLVGCSPWGCKRVGLNLVTKQLLHANTV